MGRFHRHDDGTVHDHDSGDHNRMVMPADRPAGKARYFTDAEIQPLADWIDAGCPDRSIASLSAGVEPAEHGDGEGGEVTERRHGLALRRVDVGEEVLEAVG